MAIIGAGPAGMAAAIEASRAGLSVIVFDEQSSPGGQIYRGIETASGARHKILGKDYTSGLALAERFRDSSAEYFSNTTVWNIGTDKLVEFSQNGQSKSIRAKSIVSATGALERPCPLPGWTLPGVTTAGALQILLKAAGIVQEDTVLVGSGPLLWAIAAQMVDAGIPPNAIVENLPKGRMKAALPYLLKALRAKEYLIKGVMLMQKVRRAGVPVYRHATNIKIEGEGAVEAITFAAKGKRHHIAAKYIALHQGVVPNQQITRLLSCKHFWDQSQYCFRPEVNERYETSVPDVYAIGDGAGIGGAKAAALQGRLVGLSLAVKAGKADNRDIARIRKALSREGSIRPFLEAYYSPAPDILQPADETIVCRCEEITAGTVRNSVKLGATRPNEVKSLFRTGMGPCQGRVCGLAVMGIIAAQRNEDPELVGYYRIRAPLKPIPLDELAHYAVEPGASEGRAV
ncbi:NAD(P)/FAD-dependent oxidoreductase [Brenneria izadpanahii]|uniref:FAD/NAD(P)-dependent oxidoreductase n=1 Tax=Brenneria izadpanahii TaxID=2722756 RepID=UPI001FE5452E|nr:NAD(P)/FAD-dependent oxidoreductase [Brenneria izadpanahii]